MEQYYMNCPSNGGAITAEEYAAALGRQNQNSCGCDSPTPCDCTTHRCTCQSQLVCCCREIPVPAPAPVVEEGCCCKQAFRAALQLLCNDEIADLLDFDLTAFITDSHIAGAATTESVPTTVPADNLVAPLAGTFRRFSPCSCDLLDINAPLFMAPGFPTGLTVTQANLCQLIAVVIQLAETEAEGDLTVEQVADRNLRRIRRLLSRQLNPCTPNCAGAYCPCSSCDDCCCSAGLLAALSDNNLSRQVSLAAGPLLLNGVTLLGHVGNVLVLVNEEDLRFYFVCVNHVEFIA